MKLLFLICSLSLTAQIFPTGTGAAHPIGPTGAVNSLATPTTFQGSASFISSPLLLTPSAPGVTTLGIAGITVYGYRLVFSQPSQQGGQSAETTISTGNAVLNGTNYNVITTPTCATSPANTTVSIFLTIPGGNVPTAGWIGNVACGGTFNHQGRDGDPNSVINVSSTDSAQYASNLAVGDSIGGIASWFAGFNTPFTVMNTFDDVAGFLTVNTFHNGARIHCGKAQGTPDNPLDVGALHQICTIRGWAYNGETWGDAFTPTTEIQFITGAAKTPQGLWPGSINFSLLASDGTSVNAMVLNYDKTIDINSTVNQLPLTGILFANLGSPANGTQKYCSDCKVTSGADNTCANSGTGASAFRVNGAWKCIQ